MDFLFYANLQIKDEVILMENRGLKPKNLSLARAFLEEYLELIQEYEFEPTWGILNPLTHSVG